MEKEVSDRIGEFLSQNKIGGESFDVKNPKYFLTTIGERNLIEKSKDRKIIAESAVKAFGEYEKKSGKSIFDFLFGDLFDDKTREEVENRRRGRRRRSRRGAGDPGMTAYGDNIDKAILSLIASVEAKNYDVFNQSAGKTEGKASEKTIGWLVDNAQGAIGRYQHMPRFLLGRAEAAGFDRNTVFSPEVQDKITLKFLYGSHSYAAWRSGKISDEDFGNRLSATWRGLPHSSGGTYPDQYAGRNKAHMERPVFMRKLAEIKAMDPGVVRTKPPTGEYDIIIPLDHVPPHLSGKFPDDEGKTSFKQSRSTGAAGRERDHQDNAAAKLKAKLEEKGYRVAILKPESFSSYEAYDNHIRKQSKKGVRVLPLHFDAGVDPTTGKMAGTGFLTITRSGDAEDDAFAAPIQKALEKFQKENTNLGGIGRSRQGNATVNVAAESAAALVELGVMVWWEKHFGKNFTETDKFDELIQSVADAIEKGTPKRSQTPPVQPTQNSTKRRRTNRRGRVISSAPAITQTQLAQAVAKSYDTDDESMLLLSMQGRSNPTQMPQESQSIASISTKQDQTKLSSALSMYGIGYSA